jgi:hypothetical protein
MSVTMSMHEHESCMSMPAAAKLRIPGELLDGGRGAAAGVVPFQ